MPARILNGVEIARAIREELRPRIAACTGRLGRPPGLAIVLVGEHAASEVYVRNKLKAAGESGIRVDLVRLPAAATGDEVLTAVRSLNASVVHDGILVQSPLPAPAASATRAVYDAIDPSKDVDGFHPLNIGRLVQGRALFEPCTPAGVMALLDRSGIPIAGATAVVIGRSEIVGKPMALMLLQRDATVVVCHSKTRALAEVASRADILVAAMGRAAFVTPDFIKPGAAVVDVGINRIDDASLAARVFASQPERLEDFSARGSALVGDVHPLARDVAGALTPVPGGVGPLTIAMLLSNTVKAAGHRADAG